MNSYLIVTSFSKGVLARKNIDWESVGAFKTLIFLVYPVWIKLFMRKSVHAALGAEKVLSKSSKEQTTLLSLHSLKLLIIWHK